MVLESSRGRLKALGPCTCVGDPEEAPVSWLRIGSAPAVAVTWGVNRWTEDLPLYISSSLYIWLSNNKKKNLENHMGTSKMWHIYTVEYYSDVKE